MKAILAMAVLALLSGAAAKDDSLTVKVWASGMS